MNIDYDYRLEHDEIKKVVFPEIALSGPLAPCIGIAIYDQLSKSGYIARDYGGKVILMKQAIDLAISDFKDIKKLIVGVAGSNKSNLTGNKENDEDSDKMSEEVWAELEELVNSYDFDKNNVMFYKEKKRGRHQDLYLDCKKGRIIVKAYNDSSVIGKAQPFSDKSCSGGFYEQ